MNTNTLTEQIKHLSNEVINVAQHYGLEQELAKLDMLIKKSEERKINLLVCGEFKRGKSSFINAFLNEDICPEAAGIATSAISIISYGEKPKVIRHYGRFNSTGDDSPEPLTEEIQLCDISKFADGTVDKIHSTIMLEINIPNERLKNGLTIIDTPGVGSLDPRHLFLTLYALPKADIIYFLTDAEEPMGGSELDFYLKRVASTGKIKRILVNKADLKMGSEIEEIMSDIKKKINDESANILPVSAKAWKEYNADNNNSRKHRISHCDEVHETVSQDIEKCMIYLSEVVRKQFIDILKKLSYVIEDHKKEISDSTDIENRKKQYQQQLAELKQLRDDVANPDSELRRKVSNTIKDSQKKVLSKLSEESVLLSSEKLEKILDRAIKESTNSDEFVINETNKAIVNLSSSLDEEINSSIGKVVELVGQDISVSNDSFDGALKIHINPLQQSFSEKAMNLTRQSLPFMGVTALGSTVSGVVVGIGAMGLGIESAFLPIAGIAALTPLGLIAGVIGVAAGVTYVAKTIKGDNEKIKINNIRKQITPRIQIAMNELRQYVQNRYEEFNELLVQSLKDTANQMSKQMQEIFDSLKQCETGERERQKEIKKVEEQIKFVNGRITQAQVYRTYPFNSKSSHE